MSESNSIKQKLDAMTPQILHSHTKELSNLLIGLVEGQFKPQELEALLLTRPNLAILLGEICGREIATSDAVIKFEKESNIGDVTVKQAVRGNVYYFTININNESGSRREDVEMLKGYLSKIPGNESLTVAIQNVKPEGTTNRKSIWNLLAKIFVKETEEEKKQRLLNVVNKTWSSWERCIQLEFSRPLQWHIKRIDLFNFARLLVNYSTENIDINNICELDDLINLVFIKYEHLYRARVAYRVVVHRVWKEPIDKFSDGSSRRVLVMIEAIPFEYILI